MECFSSEELHADKDGDNLQEMASLVEQADENTLIDAVHDFTELVEAHRRMDANRFTGKVVVRTG
jgi:NADPH:quinone reductase-like Zn-dependent oxidoreductase